MALGAVGAAAITRLLGPADYGQYAAAIATWSLLAAATDFGFSMMLSRDLPHTRESGVRALVRSACKAAGLLSSTLAIVMLVLAVTAGLDTARGLSLAVMAPAILSAGLAPAGALYLVRYKTRPLAVIDVSATVVTVAGQVLAAALGLGPAGVAAAASAGAILNIVLAFSYAQRHLAGPRTGASVPVRRVIRRSAPLGVLSVMTKVYLLGDLVLLGWLVSGDSLGEYAAAARMLTLLATVAALVVNAALPGFSATAADPTALSALIARVWHWLMCTAIPIFAGVAVFAGPAILILVGPSYEGAEHLLRVLCLAGFAGVLSNILGAVMVATHRTRTLFLQNAAAIALNIGGNLLLVPTYGVEASAWLTVATEAFIALAAFIVIAPHIPLRPMLAVSARPVAAIAAGAAVGLAVGPRSAIGIALGTITMVAVLSLLRGWPSEFAARVPLLRAADVRR